MVDIFYGVYIFKTFLGNLHSLWKFRTFFFTSQDLNRINFDCPQAIIWVHTLIDPIVRAFFGKFSTKMNAGFTTLFVLIWIERVAEINRILTT